MQTNINPSVVANVLIVDDRPENILVLRAVLEGSPDYTITTASPGLEALKLVKQTDFALILLDVQMPDMDGYETAVEIKKLERGKNIPIIMITAVFREDPHILKGYAAGAIDYISKPLNTDILKAKVSVYTKLYLKSRQNVYLQEVERSLQEERNAKIILDTMPIGVVVVNPSGAIEQLNQEARRIWGVGTAGLADRELYSGWWPNTGRPIQRDEWPVSRAIHAGEATLCEIIHVQCLDGTKKTVLNSAIAFRNEGQITGGVDLMLDITNQHHGQLKTEYS